MGARGRERQTKCIRGHDLTKRENVAIVKRNKNGKIYRERQCRPCKNQRAREWWHNKKEAA